MIYPNSMHVFVVDDEKTIAETLALILRQSGFVATAFTNPLTALDAARTHSPDLLISDVVMPQLNGVDLAIRLLELHPQCKILLFSGQAETADMLRRSRTEGRNFHLLAKPVHPQDLLNRIREASLTPTLVN